MADTKISALTELAAGSIATNDLIPIVDVSDTTHAASGTTKKFQVSALARVGAANTFTAAQTFPGSGIWNASGNVGIGTTNPGQKLHISSSAIGGTFLALQNTDTGGRLWNIGTMGSAGSQGAPVGAWFLRDSTLGATRIIVTATGNVGIGATDQFGGGDRVVGLANATTVPSSNPTGGGVLYAEAGALKWRGSSGTITTIANA